MAGEENRRMTTENGDPHFFKQRDHKRSHLSKFSTKWGSKPFRYLRQEPSWKSKQLAKKPECLEGRGQRRLPKKLGHWRDCSSGRESGFSVLWGETAGKSELRDNFGFYVENGLLWGQTGSTMGGSCNSLGEKRWWIRSRRQQKWWHVAGGGCVWKVELMVLANGLDVGCERMS